MRGVDDVTDRSDARVRILTVGFEGHSARPLRLAFEQIAAELPGVVERATFARDALEETGASDRLREALAGQDVVLVNGVHGSAEAALVRDEVLARRPAAFVPVLPNAAELRGIGWLVPAAESEGPDAPEVLARVRTALAEASVENATLALRLLVHAVRPAALPHDPGTPVAVPHTGYWHPRTGVVEDWDAYLTRRGELGLPGPDDDAGRVLLVCFPAQVTGGSDAHLRALVAELESRGLAVFGSLGTFDDVHDLPPADVVLNATGFTLSGSHGRPDTDGDVARLTRADVPHLGAVPLYTQTVQQWVASGVGLTPTQTAMQVAVPELEGASAPVVIAGRDAESDAFVPVPENVRRVAALAAATVRLRRTPRPARTLAFVVFGFPPATGAVGTAAHLDVWASLHAVLLRLADAGYEVEVPADPDALLDAVLSAGGGGARSGARVAARYDTGAYVRRDADATRRVSRAWGPPPGDIDTDGRSLLVHGARFGHVHVLVQPSFGDDADPMALLFRPDATPSHSFTAFYTWLRDELRPDAVVHVGTHGSLEFMPGKQVGLAPDDWSGLLVGATPHFYLYCVNDPSEGSIAKRRSQATLVSHLTPPLDRAGLYGGLLDLSELVCDARTALERGDADREIAAVAQAAAAVHLDFEPAATGDDSVGEAVDHRTAGDVLAALEREIETVRATLIPVGLHLLGAGIRRDEAAVTLRVAADHARPEHSLPALTSSLEGWLTDATPVTELPGDDLGRRCVEGVLDTLVASVSQGSDGDDAAATAAPALAVLEDGLTCVGRSEVPRGAASLLAGWARFLRRLLVGLDSSDEIGALLHALDGGYVRPGPGGEPSRHDAILPTGRNMHALDPRRVPTSAALQRGWAVAERMLDRGREADGELPETVAMVLWGVDNVKNGGEGIGQLLALLGVRPLPDPSGRVERFELVPLEDLGRPRIDVVVTMSGIFRDLFPTTVVLLDRAVRAVAQADEPDELNHVRAHARRQARELGLEVAQAATRLWSAPPGRYGAGVNHVVQAGQWDEEDDLATVFVRRTGHAWGAGLEGSGNPELLRSSLATASVTFQNIDSAETSLGDVDHYYEYLGGLTSAVRQASGRRPTSLVADSYAARPTVRPLAEAMSLESRTRLLNPRWYEAQLAHGYQGVAAVARRLENAFGMQATAGAVPGWVFTESARTFPFDDAMRDRLAALNPQASLQLAERLLEARDRGLWEPDEEDAERLEQVAADLDDLAEGVA